MKSRKLTDITTVVVHCSGTEAGMNFTAKHINDWHSKDPQFGGKIGYHRVILLDGTEEKGRDFTEVGVHAAGYNWNSIGVCYIGGLLNGKFADTRTIPQKTGLITSLKGIMSVCPNIKQIIGHCDAGSTKACPCFDAKSEYLKLV
jgi:N-acetylmuramoyl-L-alanine amidase